MYNGQPVNTGSSTSPASTDAEAPPKDDGAGKMPRKPRPDRSHISTLEELLAARERSDMKKMSLGGGLEARFHEDGSVKFFYRLGGKGGTDYKLGDSGSMSIGKARQRAKSYHDLVLADRDKKRVQKLRERSRSIAARNTKTNSIGPATPKASSLETMADIGRFVRTLHRGRGLKRAGLQDDVASLIHLLVLTPVEPEELITARWADILYVWSDIQYAPWLANVQQWRFNKADRNGKSIATKGVFLSFEAQEVIRNIQPRQSGEEYLFPRLAIQPKSAAMKEVAEGVKLIGSRANCTIDPSGFREIFKEVACGQSYFSSPLVDAVMLNDPGDETCNYYVFQMYQLVQWWGFMVRVSYFA